MRNFTKKSRKATWKHWSPVFFTFGLAVLVWATVFAFGYKSYEYAEPIPDAEVITEVVSNPNAGDGEKGKIDILSLKLEDIEGLANTIAGRNAIFPGYKGDPNDAVKVQLHFSKSFAKLINSGIIQVNERWSGKSIAFAYAVSNTGVIQFVGKIPGGNLNDLNAYASVQEGISGVLRVTPAQDEAGEDIIMLYYIKLSFSVH